MSKSLLLKKDVERWNQWRRKHSEVTCSLAKQDLSNGYFYEANLSGVDLSGANLEGACLIGADLTDANLTGARVTNAYVDDARFLGATLTDADFTGTNVERSDMRRALSLGNQLALSQDDRREEGVVAQEGVDQEEGAEEEGAEKEGVNCADIAQARWGIRLNRRRDSRGGRFVARGVAIASIILLPVAISRIWLDEPLIGTVLEVSSEARNTQKVRVTSRKVAAVGLSPTSSSVSAASSRAFGRFDLVKSLAKPDQTWAVATRVQEDGRVLVVSGGDANQIKVWDGPSGEVLHTLLGHDDTVRALALSSTGERLVSGSGDGIKVWQPQTGKLLYSLPPVPASPVWTLAVSPDNRWFVSGDYLGNVSVWDLETGALQYEVGVDSPVWSVAIAPNGQSFMSGSGDRIVRQWNLATGDLEREFVGHEDAVRAVAVSPDGKLLASGSWDNTIKLWDISSGQLRGTLLGHRDHVVSLAISPEGDSLVSGSKDNTLKLWDIPSRQLIETLDKSSGWVLSVDFDWKENTLVSGGQDQTIELWQ